MGQRFTGPPVFIQRGYRLTIPAKILIFKEISDAFNPHGFYRKAVRAVV